MAFVAAPTASVLLVALILLLGALGYRTRPEELWLRFAIAGVYGLYAAYIPTLLLGVPAYLLLRRRVRLTARSGAITGALVAALPVGAVLLAAATVHSAAQPGHGFAWGVTTLFAAAGLGGFGGWVFWLVAEGLARPSRRPSP